MPWAWDEGGCFLYGWEERGCQYSSGVNGERHGAHRRSRLGKARCGFGLTAERKRANTPTKEGWRRKRERSRQREFVTAGADSAPDTVTQERCRDQVDVKPEGAISRPGTRSGR